MTGPAACKAPPASATASRQVGAHRPARAALSASSPSLSVRRSRAAPHAVRTPVPQTVKLSAWRLLFPWCLRAPRRPSPLPSCGGRWQAWRGPARS